MSEATKLINKAVLRIREAVERFNPLYVVALFSGGHDSGAASLIAHEAGADITLHINTGIGVEQTRDYVRETCDRRNWNLREYKSVENTYANGKPNPQIYDDLVRRWGFPGPPQHAAMYQWLKERQIERFERDIGVTSKRPVLYVGGQRSDESERRKMNMLGDKVKKKGRQVWVSAIHDFSKSDCASCIAHCGLKRNEVVDLIHKSGECLCGAFAAPGEFAELKVWFPDVAKRIENLEREVADKFPWKWEDAGPPVWWSEKNQGQTFMFDYDKPVWEPLCQSCNIKHRNGQTNVQQTIL